MKPHSQPVDDDRPRFAPGRAIPSALLALAILLSFTALSAAWMDAGVPGQGTLLTRQGDSASLPVFNERQERPQIPAGRGLQVSIPPDVLEDGPVVYGVVVLPLRDTPPLTSYLVYTQTTSSRL